MTIEDEFKAGEMVRVRETPALVGVVKTVCPSAEYPYCVWMTDGARRETSGVYKASELERVPPDETASVIRGGSGRAEAVWPLVAEDLRRRDEVGRQLYGDSLRSSTPVDLLTYAYEEALDLVIYLKGELERRRADKG